MSKIQLPLSQVESLKMRFVTPALLTTLLAGSAALAEGPRVITDLPVVHSLTAQVMGDLGAPELLLDKGADAHSFQLRPSQAAGLADSDLLIWLGPEMTPWLERSVASLAPDMPRLTLLDAPETYVRLFGDGDAPDDHAEHDDHSEHDDHAGHDDHTGHDDHAEHDDHTGHDDHAGHADHEGHDDHAGHDHAGIDPHAWLDPANARVWLTLIADRLSTLDPDNAATYALNAAKAQTAIDVLDAEMAALLAPIKDRPFVAAHDAYGYLTDHYGLRLVGTVALGDASSPGAARLAALRETITESGAVCLFPEVQNSPELLTEIASDTDTRIGGALDPSGTALEPGPDSYALLMRALATTLADCLAP